MICDCWCFFRGCAHEGLRRGLAVDTVGACHHVTTRDCTTAITATVVGEGSEIDVKEAKFIDLPAVCTFVTCIFAPTPGNFRT